jgi:DNA-binding transcriptional MerR regulator
MSTQTPDSAPRARTGLSMSDAARLTGLPTETLRYYDRAGLLGELPRTAGNHRVFDEQTLGLLDVIIRLRRTGMPIEDVRRFADLVRAGDQDRPARIALLQEHRARVRQQLDALTADLAVIEWKIAAYTAAEDGTAAPTPPHGWPWTTLDLPEGAT